VEASRLNMVYKHGVITVPAEIDATNADEIRQALLAAVSDLAVVIIDMSATTFCDSAGVHAIMAARRQAEGTGTDLRLVATAVLRILTLVGADQLIPIYPTCKQHKPQARSSRFATGSAVGSAVAAGVSS
jgi:anti-sigma B factor antagonist